MKRDHAMKRTQIFLKQLCLFSLIVTAGCKVSPSNNQSETPITLDRLTTIASPLPDPSPSPTISPAKEGLQGQINQWAVSAIDQQATESAAFAIGEPDSDGCDLMPLNTSWVYETDDLFHAEDYLQLFYPEPVLPTGVRIHLAYTYSSIVKISLIDLLGNPHTIYKSTPGELDACPHLLSIDIEDIAEPVYSVRIDVATLNAEDFGLTAIDAVELIGTPLSEPYPTPQPTPHLTISSIGINAAEVEEGHVHFEVFDHNTDQNLITTDCDAFSYNVSDSETIIRFFSCDDSTEIWLYLPSTDAIDSTPLNSYDLIPTARLFYNGQYIPAMEGELWIDQLSETRMSGVLEFKGFDPANQVDYYRTVAVFNQIPHNAEAALKPGDMITQWVEHVSSSSELSPDENSTAQALGSSDTWFECADAFTAWKPDPSDQRPWIELYFKTPVIPQVLNILLTGCPEGISQVNLLTDTDYFPLDLASAGVSEECPVALMFNPILDIHLPVIGVQIVFESGVEGCQPGLDAVQMIGTIPE